jgi:N-acylneuraminate cytidylyltransferase
VKSERIAIIPARSKSKRIPNKNVVEAAGKPLLCWTIEAALESECFSRVVVSTDSDEIASIAKEAGAEVPFLRNAFHDDHSTSSEATIHALEQSIAHWSTEFEITVQLLPTCPLRNASDISRSLQIFEDKGRVFQISAQGFGWANPSWAAHLRDDGTPEWVNRRNLSARSQDLPGLVTPSGAIWIANSSALINAGTFYGPGLCLEQLSLLSSIDIDEIEHLEIARMLLASQGVS